MKTKYLLMLLFTFGGALLAFVFYFLLKLLIKDEEEKRRTAVVTKSKKSRKFSFFKLYRRLVRFGLTRPYLLRLQRIYEIRIPNDSKQSKEQAMKLALEIWLVDLLLIILLFVRNPSFLMAATTIFYIYVFSDSFVRNKVNKFDLELITQLSTFIDDVRHQYFVHEMVDEAIESSLEKAPKLMKLHGQAIYNVVTSYEIDDELQKYCRTVPSYFLKMFADTCAKIMQYGDKVVDNQSLFLVSIQNLKEEIQMEQIKQQGLSHKFSMLVGCTVVPILFIGPMIKFCCSSFSAMVDLFNGNYGKIAAIVMFSTTFGIYQLVLKLRDSVHVDLQPKTFWLQLYKTKLFKKPVDQFLTKNWSKSLKLKNTLKMTGSMFDIRSWTTRNFCSFAITLVIAIVGISWMHISSKANYGSSITSVASTTSGASDEECYEMLVIARQMLEDYKDIDFRKMYNAANPTAQTPYFDKDVLTYTQEILMARLTEEDLACDEELAYSQIDPFLAEHDSTTSSIKQLKGLSYEEASNSSDVMVTAGFHNFQKLVKIAMRKDNKMSEDVRNTIVKSVAKQIKKYQNEFFHWYDLVVAILIAIFAYNVPAIALRIEKVALQADMEDEVIQFKSSIMLLMYLDRVTVEVILDSLLMIARIFEPSIQKCINDLPLDEEKAFDKLIDDEPFDAFKRLVENLRMVDKVGVLKAFSTVKSERKNYQEKRKQENEISLDKRGSIAQFIAYLPANILVVFYMVVPFGIEAISEFQHALESMQTYM